MLPPLQLLRTPNFAFKARSHGLFPLGEYKILMFVFFSRASRLTSAGMTLLGPPHRTSMPQADHRSPDTLDNLLPTPPDPHPAARTPSHMLARNPIHNCPLQPRAPPRHLLGHHRHHHLHQPVHPDLGHKQPVGPEQQQPPSGRQGFFLF